jgi:nicotinate-nucleotide pyrophosphorylase (carboxylating)
LWFQSIQESDFAVFEIGDDLAGVIPVVTFAGEDKDGIAWSGELADSGCEDMADAADDFEGGSFCSPGALFPIPHLAAADDWGRHRAKDGPGLGDEQVRSGLGQVSTSGFERSRHAGGMEERLREEMDRVVRGALAEDIGSGDVTTLATVGTDCMAVGDVVAREPLVVSGLEVAVKVFGELSGELECECRVRDGAMVASGDVIMQVRGSAAALLTGERTALNLMQQLSGVASLTRRYVEAVEGTGVRILDTRKTLPGLRWLQKQAVRHGGGTNHRVGLFDAVLIKDNHLAALAEFGAGAVGEAVRRARERFPGLLVEVEADRLDQVLAAMEAGADVVLLDNMSLEALRDAVKLAEGRIRTEASGGVDLTTVRDIALTGVDAISVGALTHSARAVDLALDMRVLGPREES